MFLSKFYRVGAHAVRNFVKAPIRAQRAPYYPAVCNQYIYGLRHELFCSTASKLESEDGNEDTIDVTFVGKDGEEIHTKVPVGMSMLEAAHEYDLDLEGACEASLACSTCHVIVTDMAQYNKLPEPTDEELDMLDLAFGLTETSRLGCQIIAQPELDGLRLQIPGATRNFAVDGYKAKHH